MRIPYLHAALVVLCLFSIDVKAQNMVPNGDFEAYTSCPTGYSQTTNCPSWRSYHAGSTDYFNSCATVTTIDVPVNYFGTQAAASGNGYAGGYVYSTGGTDAYREYLATAITPLTPGATYHVSMSVSLAEHSNKGVTGLGIWFYDNGPSTSMPGSAAIIMTPQVSFSSYGAITDTANWVRLVATFTADSAYDNIVVGNFESVSTMTMVTNPTGNTPFCYYYIDSVVVKNIKNFKIDTIPPSLCNGDTMKAPFTLNGNFAATNVFTLQLSDASGSFASATSIGSITGNTNGMFKYVIPSTITPGAGYRVRIKSSNPVDSTQYDKNISIGIYPTNFTVSSNTPVCTRDTLKLFASATGSNITYQWNGPLINSNVQNPYQVNPSTAASGYYVAKASVFGCAVKDSVNVLVKQSPIAISAGLTGAGGCEPQTFSLSATNSNPSASYAWTGPNSYSSSTQNPTVINAPFAAGGKYYVSATTGNGCYVYDSVAVIIKPAPQGFTVSSNSPVCQSNLLTLSAFTPSSGVSYVWSGPNSFVSAVAAPTISNAQSIHSGKYKVVAQIGGCSAMDSVLVSVIPIPAMPMPTANTPVCIGQTLNLNAGGSAPGYLWSGPASFSSNVQNPSLTGANATMAGVYTVKAYDGACASPTASVTVNVIAAPTANMYPSPKDSICNGTMVTFFASSSNAGTAPVYKWYHNNTLIPGASGSSYNTNTTADYDEYYCTVTSNGTCAVPYTTSGNMIQMRVFPWMTPAVSITSTNPNVNGGDLITFTAAPVNGGNFPTYQWKRNNKDVVGALSYTWGAKTLDDKDNVCVTMTSSYLCPNPKTASSNCIKVNINTTGIDEATFSKVYIYPNPVNNELVIEGIAKNTKIQLLDVLGRTVISITSTKDKEVLNTSSLLPGAYVLQLHSAHGKQMSARVVKE